MKLDVSCMRYLSRDDYRVLTSIEQGMRNHEIVPVELISSISKLRNGGINKILSLLLRHKLIAHEQLKYNGYRLSYLGYDILALRTLLSRGIICSVGSQIGVGKESDIFEAQNENGEEVVIKIHRLGRTSFRSVRKTRDYMQNKSKSSWLYMSRLAAIKEYTFMQALYARDFPTPKPIDQNRHVIVMSRIHGVPLSQVQHDSITQAPLLFLKSIQILKKLVSYGLIHCDFNEFNLMITSDDNNNDNNNDPDSDITKNNTIIENNTNNTELQHYLNEHRDNSGYNQLIMIDFPQIISTNHINASEMFSRDLNGIIKYFTQRLKYSLDITTPTTISLSSLSLESSSTTLNQIENEEDLKIKQQIIEELIGKDGEIITLEEIMEEQRKVRNEKRRKRKEKKSKNNNDNIEDYENENDENDGNIFEEIRRQYNGGGVSHEDDRYLMEYLEHNREHKDEMIKEIKELEKGNDDNENESDDGDDDDEDNEEYETNNNKNNLNEMNQENIIDHENDEEEENDQENDEEDEQQPLKNQEEIRNALRRDMVRKHSNKQGSRNATKKRNKYGKVERINIKHEW